MNLRRDGKGPRRREAPSAPALGFRWGAGGVRGDGQANAADRGRVLLAGPCGRALADRLERRSSASHRRQGRASWPGALAGLLVAGFRFGPPAAC